ncbi:MAG TPA: nucleotidyltransferase family protein [Candidatus Melainabacteria bacterium]|nr:nucleotidyltransferase family protein [Candidatus Melainabacteria bacterium]
MEAIILAGGQGKRLRSVVPDLPKPMAAVCNRPFLEHLLDYWLDQGVTRVVFSVGHKFEDIKSHFNSSYRDIPLDYAIEDYPLGTGGGLFLAANRTAGEGPVLVLNGDTFFQVSLESMLLFHNDKKASLTLALFRAREEKRYGVIELDTAARVVEMKTDSSGSRETSLMNGGVYLFSRSLLMTISRVRAEAVSLEHDIFPRLIKDPGAVYGYESQGRFIDIGTPEDYSRVEQTIFGKVQKV